METLNPCPNGRETPREQAREALDETTQRLQEKASEAVDQLKQIGCEAREAASESMEYVREMASEYLEQGREKAEEVRDQLAVQIREKPVPAVLVAASLGFMLGLIWSRR